MRRVINALILVLVKTEAANILGLFPVPSFSHQLVFRPFTQNLANNHKVVAWTPNPAFKRNDTPSNLTEIDLYDVSYNLKGPAKDAMMSLSAKMYYLEAWRLVLDVFNQVFMLQLNSTPAQGLLKSTQKFDLVFSEAITPMSLIMSSIYKAPVIQISSFSALYKALDSMSVSTHPLFYPEMSRRYFWQDRLYNVFGNLRVLYEDYYIKTFKYYEEFVLDGYPSISELQGKVDMLFLNMHPLWDGNRPVSPNVVYVNDLHEENDQEIDADLKSYLHSSANGIIYMSFGTNVDPTQFSPRVLEVFCKVFSKLPYDVLFKWNGGLLPGKPENMITEKWFPQAKLLKHPNVKLFVTHSGLQSTDEAITAGVPLIGFPMLADQFYNAEKYEQFGIGINLDIKTITEQVFEQAVMTVLNGTRYQENIVQLRSIMRDQPQSPLQRAVWWTEHALRHRGAAHLRCPAANGAWADYLMLDVVFTLLGIPVALVFSIMFLLKLVVIVKRYYKLLSLKRVIIRKNSK